MAKRGYGEGSIIKRSDGRWMGQIELGWVNGRRKRKYIYGATRKEVAEKMRTLQVQHSQGFTIAPERQTVAMFLERWLADVVKPYKRPGTYRIYMQHVRLHIVPRIGRVQLTKLTAQQVQEMLQDELNQGLSPVWVQRTRDVLRNALNVAVEWEFMRRNVAMHVKAPTVEEREPTVFTVEQLRHFLTAIRGDRLEALYRVVLAFGLRESEVLGLRWQDLDEEKATLAIKHQIYVFDTPDDLAYTQRMSGYVVHPLTERTALVRLKTKRGQRLFPLFPSLLKTLQQHRAQQLQDHLFAGRRWQAFDLMFPTSVGTPISPRNLYRSFQAELKKADLPQMHFHELRHSCATFLSLLDVDIRVIMKILGHTDIKMTARYAGVLDDSTRAALGRLDRLFDDQEEVE